MVVSRWAASGRRASAFAGFAALSMLVVACRSKSTGNGGRPAGSAAVATEPSAPPPGPPAPLVCTEQGAAPALTVGQAQARAKPSDPENEDEQEVELPFSVDLGAARASAERFGVGGIQTRSGASYAFVALVDAKGGGGQSLELGRVFGEVDPPAVVPYKDRWLALVADHDASSVVLRLFALAPPFDAASLRRGAELGSARRDAAEFALESSGEGVLLAFTKLEKGRGSIVLGNVDAEKLTLLGSPVTVQSAGEGEAESPRLARRPGGYFLAYIVRGAAARPKLVPRKQELDGGVESLLDEGPTAVEVVPLDVKGIALGPPRRATPASAHVIAFDLAPAPDGGALLEYRDDRDGPGLDRSSAEAVHVRADGSLTTRTWEVGESAGLPALLVDATPPGSRPWAWLFASSERGAGLAALTGDALALGEIATEAHLSGAEVLAASGGRLLVGRPRGGQRDLSVMECRINPAAPKPLDGGI
jgi:hypothetical protein